MMPGVIRMFRHALILVSISVSCFGCGGSETQSTSIKQLGPNDLSPGAYTQTSSPVPASLDDPFLSINGPWTGVTVKYLWGFVSSGVSSLYSSLTVPPSEVIVAVIDTGVDKDHEDLAGRLWVNHAEYDGGKYNNGLDNDGNGLVNDYLGWDFANGDNNPADDNGHGTHVSGTIAAVGNNSKGIVGLAPWVRIMPLKVCDKDGVCNSSAIRAAISYAAAHGAKVANISIGGPDDSDDVEGAAFDAVVRGATDQGMLVVVAAGNRYADTGELADDMTPANSNNAVAVGAYRNDNAICHFSDRGWKVDVAAPGCGLYYGATVAGILSLDSKKCGGAGDSYCSSSYVVSEGYVLRAGTSMATPHVAGMAAVAFTASPTATPLQIRQAILTTANAGANTKDWNSGAGLFSATNLITEAQSAPGIKIRSPRHGAKALTHHIEYRIEPRSLDVPWELRAIVDTGAHTPVNLATGGSVITSGTATAGSTTTATYSWTPGVANQTYLVVLKATVGGKNYFDTVLLKTL